MHFPHNVSLVRIGVCVCVSVVQLLMMMGVRKLMDFLFTRSELYWLDHNLPGDERVSREDEQAQAHAYSPVRFGNSSNPNCLSVYVLAYAQMLPGRVFSAI